MVAIYFRLGSQRSVNAMYNNVRNGVIIPKTKIARRHFITSCARDLISENSIIHENFRPYVIVKATTIFKTKHNVATHALVNEIPPMMSSLLPRSVAAGGVHLATRIVRKCNTCYRNNMMLKLNKTKGIDR